MTPPRSFLASALTLVALVALLAPLPGAAQSADCNIWWGQVLHDSFSPDYRSPGGPVAPGTTVRLRLRVAQSDITSARVRVWDDRTNTQTFSAMAWDGGFDADPTTYDWWFVDLPVGGQPTVLYYFFELNDAPGWCSADQDFYTDDDPKFYGGGYGAMSDAWDDSKSFQLTVYDPAFAVPSWIQRGTVYQIFPDRFRDGATGNDPTAGRFFYGEAGGTITRSTAGGNNPSGDWNSTLCDPRATYSPSCAGKYSSNFYGGDLAGIRDKIEQGYFDTLGVTVLYLNPVFRSPSNHKYDTADFLLVDPDFGTLADFQALAASADAHGMRLILDGVFNHTSSDSTYFDFYRRWDPSGNLTSPDGPGADDDSGGCEAGSSPFYGWYYFPDIGNPGGGGVDLCPNGPGDAPQTYEAWFGYGSLPKLRSGEAAVRALVYSNGAASVGPYWTAQGAGGWRFDVGGDVDPGLTNDPGNLFWEGYRTAVRDAGVTGRSDTLLLGEEWGDASAWLLGNEWDSVMNYRFRSAVLSWLFTGCSGSGCVGGTQLYDNDSDPGSASGPISYISPSQFNARLRSIAEDYPPMAWRGMLNLLGSHDTNRFRFLLKKANTDSDAAAVQRMKEAWIFAFSYAGAPTLYYGDEVGLSHDGVWSGGKWEDDPYNRAPYPWPDEAGGSYAPDTSNLLPHARTMSSARHAFRALQDGDVQHGLIVDDTSRVYGFARTNGSGTALVALNRDGSAHSAVFTGLNAAPFNLADGTVLRDALSGSTYTVAGGSVTVPVGSNWGAVLAEDAEVDVPAAAAGLTAAAAGADRELTWQPVTTDAAGDRELAVRYEVHRSAATSFTPGPATLLATVTPAPFGTADGLVHFTDTGAAGLAASYVVRSFNAFGASSDTALLWVGPSLSIADVAAAEGSSGTTTFTFTISLSSPAGAGGVSFDLATADGTATTADSDYVAASATGATIAAGGSSATFDVTVNGDTAIEPDETFAVTVGNVTGAAVTDGSGQGTILNDDYPCAAALPLAAGQWRQLGLPCVASSTSLGDLLGDDLGLPGYGTAWRVYRWEEVTGSYVMLGLGDSLLQGEGYWVKSTVGGVVDVAGDDTSTATDFLIPVTGGAGDGLFNMPGHPFDFTVDWPDVTVDCGAGEESLLDAEGAGRVWANLWKWNGSAHQSFRPLVPGAEGQLAAFDGFWFRARAAGCTLHVPPTPAEGRPGAEVHSGPWGWYVRLEASSGDLVDPGNILGQHRQASTGHDRMDLEELPPFDGDFLTVVFPHPEWGTSAGDFTVDYHRLGTPDQWRFEVRSSRPEAEVTLRWRGPARALRVSTLVDEQTGEEIRVFRRSGEGTTTFTLKDGRRSFLWRVRRVASETDAASE